MNNHQYKDAFLRSKVTECLHDAASQVHQGTPETAIWQLSRALAYARQLPDNTKYRALRMHIMQAKTALEKR